MGVVVQVSDMSSNLPSLSELFAGADRIGRKYQTAQEIEAHEQEVYDIRKDIEAMLEGLTPDAPDEEDEINALLSSAGM